MENNENIFNKYIGEENVVNKETGEVIEKPGREEREIAEREASVSKDVLGLYNKVKDIAISSEVPMTKDLSNKIFSNLHGLKKFVYQEKGLNWRSFNQDIEYLPNSIYECSRQGLLLANNEIFIDIRNNKNTPNLKDIKIKLQYQGVEKLMQHFYFDKQGRHVDHFFSDVICSDDEFEAYNDLETGSRVIKKHIYGKSDRNRLENIIGAYYILYLENDKGEKSRITIDIDKNRIERARKASTMLSGGIWNSDTRKMVLKTVVWEAFKAPQVRPFLKTPEELLKIVAETEKDMDWDKETKDKTKQDSDFTFTEYSASETVDNDF